MHQHYKPDVVRYQIVIPSHQLPAFTEDV